MADSRISRTLKGAITTFLPKPDKEEEELEMVQNEPTADYATHGIV